jgi:hypothetical protein
MSGSGPRHFGTQYLLQEEFSEFEEMHLLSQNVCIYEFHLVQMNFL